MIGGLLVFACFAGVATAAAQVHRDSRFLLGANLGVQTTVNTRTDRVNFELFGETGRFAATQELKRNAVLDGGFAARLWKGFGVGVSVARVRITSTAMIAAEVPHPFFFEFPRSVSGPADGLVHREVAVHLQGQYWMPLGERLRLTIFMGPTLFDVKQDLVAEITTAERGFPFDQADITSHTLESISTTAYGYNLGFDLTCFGLRQIGFLEGFDTLDRVGVAFMLRYMSRAEQNQTTVAEGN